MKLLTFSYLETAWQHYGPLNFISLVPSLIVSSPPETLKWNLQKESVLFSKELFIFTRIYRRIYDFIKVFCFGFLLPDSGTVIGVLRGHNRDFLL